MKDQELKETFKAVVTVFQLRCFKICLCRISSNLMSLIKHTKTILPWLCPRYIQMLMVFSMLILNLKVRGRSSSHRIKKSLTERFQLWKIEERIESTGSSPETTTITTCLIPLNKLTTNNSFRIRRSEETSSSRKWLIKRE